MNSLQVQVLIPEKNQEDIRIWLIDNHYPCSSFDQKLIYLGYLIARGQFEVTSYFLTDLYDNNQEELVKLVNTSHELFWDGTVLNFALYYNAGQQGMEFFELLCSRGARFLKDGYGLFPWQQLGTLLWLFPLSSKSDIDLGERNDHEFEFLYQDIIDRYVETNPTHK